MKTQLPFLMPSRFLKSSFNLFTKNLSLISRESKTLSDSNSYMKIKSKPMSYKKNCSKKWLRNLDMKNREKWKPSIKDFPNFREFR